MLSTPNASYSLTLRLEIDNAPGMLGKVASAIGDLNGDIGAIDLVQALKDKSVRDITVNTSDDRHGQKIVERVRQLEGVRVVNVSDRTFLMHLGGKIEIHNKIPVKTRDDLSMAYTPGVARVCKAIAEDPSRVFQLTIKRNTVAVVTDGSAVLGLGNIGPQAALPVMEGKAMLFKEFAGLDAFPLCLDTQDVDSIVATVKHVAPAFGGINLEDISAPRCFEIEERLKADLDIPVFHDDQHGTAVVVLAALLNALKLVGKRMEDLTVVMSGVGAAGVASTKILLAAGIKNVIGFDRSGAIYRGRGENMNHMKEWYAENTNPGGFRGCLRDALKGADMFLGVSGPTEVRPQDLALMGREPIVFALANPTPEVAPEDVADVVKVIATGRSDYPNQINNVLCFPGIFKGALECRASEINEEMKLAAANAIAGIVTESELREDYIIPSVFNRRVAPAVANAVIQAAFETGVARRTPKAE